MIFPFIGMTSALLRLVLLKTASVRIVSLVRLVNVPLNLLFVNTIFPRHVSPVRLGRVPLSLVPINRKSTSVALFGSMSADGITSLLLRRVAREDNIKRRIGVNPVRLGSVPFSLVSINISACKLPIVSGHHPPAACDRRP